MPFQSSKGPVSVTSSATTPSHRGFRTAGILGVAQETWKTLKLQTWNSKIKGQFKVICAKPRSWSKGRDTIAFIPRCEIHAPQERGMLEKMSFWVFVTSVYFWGKAHFHSWDQLIGKVFFFLSQGSHWHWLVVTQMVLLLKFITTAFGEFRSKSTVIIPE